MNDKKNGIYLTLLTEEKWVYIHIFKKIIID